MVDLRGGGGCCSTVIAQFDVAAISAFVVAWSPRLAQCFAQVHCKMPYHPYWWCLGSMVLTHTGFHGMIQWCYGPYGSKSKWKLTMDMINGNIYESWKLNPIQWIFQHYSIFNINSMTHNIHQFFLFFLNQWKYLRVFEGQFSKFALAFFFVIPIPSIASVDPKVGGTGLWTDLVPNHVESVHKNKNGAVDSWCLIRHAIPIWIE